MFEALDSDANESDANGLDGLRGLGGQQRLHAYRRRQRHSCPYAGAKLQKVSPVILLVHRKYARLKGVFVRLKAVLSTNAACGCGSF
jgi:hypothetical protein